jgi:hypothetical protein
LCTVTLGIYLHYTQQYRVRLNRLEKGEKVLLLWWLRTSVGYRCRIQGCRVSRCGEGYLYVMVMS